MFFVSFKNYFERLLMKTKKKKIEKIRLMINILLINFKGRL